MKKILIPTTEIQMNGMQTRTHLARETYTDKLIQYGLVPIFVTPNLTQTMVDELWSLTSGLLLMGGMDVDPDAYGATERHQHLSPTNPRQDALEIALFERARTEKRPTLGICRGHQLMNVAGGGTLHQHVPDLGGDVVHDGSKAGGNYDLVRSTFHDITIESNTRLSLVLGQENPITVNSGHHQAVATVAPGFRVSAQASDGIIEAIEAEDADWFAFGVQSHPEVQTSGPLEPLFEELAQAIKDY